MSSIGMLESCNGALEDIAMIQWSNLRFKIAFY